MTLKQLGNYNLNFYHRLDWDTQWSSADVINLRASTSVLGDNLPITLGGSEAVTSHIDVPKLKNIIQFKLETNTTDPAWTLFRIEELAEIRGVQA